MKYLVVVPEKVQKELNKIPNLYRQKIIATLSVLANNPYCGKKLEGEHKGERSLKVWPYRIIYRIKQRELLLLLIKDDSII